MKLSSLLVGASIALNVVLVVALVGHVAVSGDEGDASAAKPASPAPVVAKAPASAEAWASIQTGDLPAQVERLKAEGFPPATIRAIMAATVRAQFAARRKALEGTATPYWETPVDPKQMLAMAALEREERKILRDLLGPDPVSGPAAQLRRMLPNLAEDKLEQLAALRERFQEEQSDFYAGRRGALAGDDGRKMEEMEKAFRARVAAVLSPQELEEFDLRESRTAQQLRYSLAAFDATEQEYRTIFRLQSAFDAQYGQNYRSDMSEDEMRARTAAQAQVKEQIKSALGDARYAEYERGTDTSYRRTTQLVARLNLPPETANEIYSLQKDIQSRAMEIRRGGAAAPGGTAPALAALATEAEAKLVTKLGPVGLEAYKGNNMGSWLNNLTPRTRPAAIPAAPKP